MKQVLLMITVVALVGCGESAEEKAAKAEAAAAEAKAEVNATTTPKTQPKEEVSNPQPPKVAPEKLITDPIVEEAVRTHLHAKTGFAAGKEIKGELTKADLERVTALGFSYGGLTNEGLKEVVAKLPKLTYLDLGRTKITDVGLKEVAKMKQLKELDLTNAKTVTKEGVAELQEALPKCKISHDFE